VTKVPLVIFEHGERLVIGSCDVEKTEQGGFELSGIIEHPRYEGMLQSKNNPDCYSVSVDLVENNMVEVAYVPPLLIPEGRSKFTATLPPLPWRMDNDD